MSTLDNLKAARALLVTRGWTRWLMVDNTGRMCVLGAVKAATAPGAPDTNHWPKLFSTGGPCFQEAKWLAETLRLHPDLCEHVSGDYTDVIKYNEYIAENISDVLCLFDTTIERLEQ